jgi:hypothetical protein
MNRLIEGPRPRHALLAAVLGGLLLAGPLGAHGPDGDHHDAPAAAASAQALPRMETFTEAFELVAELRPGELVILVDHYETNEPVLGAMLEVESGALKAEAAFRAEQGDYAVTDAAMLQALAQPGEHALVFTLIAGDESDLLDGTLVATRATPGDRGRRAGLWHTHDDDADHGHGPGRAAWIGAGIAAIGAAALVAGLASRRRRARLGGRPEGSL